MTVRLRTVLGGVGTRRSERRRSDGSLIPVRRDFWNVTNVVWTVVIFRIVTSRVFIRIRPPGRGSGVCVVVVVVVIVFVIVKVIIVIVTVFLIVIVGNEVTDCGRVGVARVRRRGRSVVRRRQAWRRRCRGCRRDRIRVRRRVFIL